MSTDLVPHTAATGALVAAEETPWQAQYELATKLANSGIIPVPLRRKPDDVFVVLMTGRELGLSPMLALRSIHVIDGKPVLSADIMAGVVARSPVCAAFRQVEMTDKACTYIAQRKGEPEPTSYRYTLDDAKNAGLLGKQNWRNHPKAMLRARCASMAARAHFPDLVANLYDPEELEHLSTGAPAAEKPTALAEFKARVIPQDKLQQEAQAIADATPPPNGLAEQVAAVRVGIQPDAVAQSEDGIALADGPEPPSNVALPFGEESPKVPPKDERTPAEIATALCLRIATIENKHEAANWKKKHAAEIEALPPAERKRVLEAAKKKAAEFANA